MEQNGISNILLTLGFMLEDGRITQSDYDALRKQAYLLYEYLTECDKLIPESISTQFPDWGDFVRSKN